jgi:hypothetical protein
MSQTLFIEYRGRGFWTYDVVPHVFLKCIIDAAMPRSVEPDGTWLADVIRRWRVQAVVSDYSMHLDDGWTQSQVEVFRSLIDIACRRLEEREAIPAAEIEAWEILDDLRICARGMKAVPTKPVIQFGRAVMALVDGSLPKAPVGTWWFYGTENERGMIRAQDPQEQSG